MICLKADEPVEDLLVAFFCHTGSGQALWSFRASTKSDRIFWKRENWLKGLLEKNGFWGWEKEKTTFLNLRIWNYYTLPRMPVTTKDYSIFQFFSRESQPKPLWELMLCSPAFELSMFWWFEMFSRTFSGQAWRDGVWSICWEGVTRWEDGFFQEAFKV